MDYNKEIERCKNDFPYYCEKYMTFIIDKNTNEQIKLTKFQKELLKKIKII